PCRQRSPSRSSTVRPPPPPPPLFPYTTLFRSGPMHVGHCRGAVVGDALAGLLDFAGYDVTREYYVNDAGAQVDDVARSAFQRYRSEEHTSELQSRSDLVCRLLLEKKKASGNEV